MTDEPRRHRFFLIVLALVILGTVPFLFVGRTPALMLGLPLWLWSSIVFTVALSTVTAWGIVRYWKDEDFD